jgi:hypothetical protein
MFQHFGFFVNILQNLGPSVKQYPAMALALNSANLTCVAVVVGILVLHALFMQLVSRSAAFTTLLLSKKN